MKPTKRMKHVKPQSVAFLPKTSGDYRVRGPVRGSSRPSMYDDLYQPRRRSLGPTIGIVCAVFIVAIGLFVGLGGLPAAPEDGETQAPEVPEVAPEPTPTGATALEPLVVGAGMETGSGPGRLSFCAVGDNVVNDGLLTAADAAAGTIGDGAYDFKPLFSAVTSTIANDYDVAFINQETVLGGDGNFGFTGYPSYNSPDAVAEALVDGGWDVINCNSNHSYDIGADGIRHEIELWKNYPEVLPIGMYENAGEAERVRIIERNGIRVAFLSYCYGLNGYELEGDGTIVNTASGVEYGDDGSLVNLITEAKLARDIPVAVSAADAVVVSLHFGEEYAHAPDETQRLWAQRCADLGADVVLGTHTHYIQPVETLQGQQGNDCLVAWCLGDFTSGYGRMDASLGGMLSFDFLRGDDGAVTVSDLRWTPTIEHLENGAYSVHFLKDYTAEMAARNELYTVEASQENTQEMVADIRAYAKTLNESIMGDAVAIDA